MKMIRTTAAVAANQYPAYVHNCLRNAQCEPSWSAPLPSVPALQLFVNFGTAKPVTMNFQLLDLCNNTQEQITPTQYVVGLDPEGNWYGVFKNFTTPISSVTTFVVWLSAIVDTGTFFVERTWFSEMMVVEPCLPLTKVKSCHPGDATTTGFDINGVYYGLTQSSEFLGNESVRYFHIAYVRLGKVRELSNKATFKSSIYRTFRSTVEKIHQLETELVPKWYKDELLAIYSRGAISFNDGAAYLVSDLNFEALNDDDLTWKPFVQIKETFRLYFGCDDAQCVECCSPSIIAVTLNDQASDSDSGDDGIFTIEFTPEFQ